MRINDRGPADLALRALRDCGVIRAHVATGPYVELWRAGLATRAAIDSYAAPTMRDYRLNSNGWTLAAQLKPWGETRRG